MSKRNGSTATQEYEGSVVRLRVIDLQDAWALISEIASSETSGDNFQFGASRCSHLETYQGMHNMSEAQGTLTATYRYIEVTDLFRSNVLWTMLDHHVDGVKRRS